MILVCNFLFCQVLYRDKSIASFSGGLDLDKSLNQVVDTSCFVFKVWWWVRNCIVLSGAGGRIGKNLVDYIRS